MNDQQNVAFNNVVAAMQKLANAASCTVDNPSRTGDAVHSFLRRINGKRITALALYRIAGKAQFDRYEARGCYGLFIDGVQLHLGVTDANGGTYISAYLPK